MTNGKGHLLFFANHQNYRQTLPSRKYFLKNALILDGGFSEVRASSILSAVVMTSSLFSEVAMSISCMPIHQSTVNMNYSRSLYIILQYLFSHSHVM